MCERSTKLTCFRGILLPWSLENSAAVIFSEHCCRDLYRILLPWSSHNIAAVIFIEYCCRDLYLDTYLLTWSGVEAAKTIPWPSRGLHHCGKSLEPSDEWAGRGCYCFLMRWHSWAFLADQEWAPETCRARIWIFLFLHIRCLTDILATSCTTDAQIQRLHSLERIVLGFCLMDTE